MVIWKNKMITQSPVPSPQSPVPSPQSPVTFYLLPILSLNAGRSEIF
ncbi:MAG: hypothetical protein ACKPEO_07720 [Sphaerospermopsis kisseleviana]